MSFHRQGFFNQYKLKFSIKRTLHISPHFCLVLSSRQSFPHSKFFYQKAFISHLFGKYRAFSIAFQKHDIGPTLDFSELVDCYSHNGRPFLYILINITICSIYEPAKLSSRKTCEPLSLLRPSGADFFTPRVLLPNI